MIDIDVQRRVNLIVDGLILHKRQQVKKGTHALMVLATQTRRFVRDSLKIARWKTLVRIVEIVRREPHLLQVIRALRTPGRLSGGLHGGGSNAIRIPMMAMTTRSSTSVNPRRAAKGNIG